MNKVSKLIVAALSVGLVFGATSAMPAQAASKVKVVSTKKVKKVAYHATKGKLYSTSKLKKVKYQIKKYPHTTWYSFKKATVKKNGKKASYTYVKAGKKSGWLYSKYLIKGKAPKVKKASKTTKAASVTTKVAPAAITQKQKFDNDLTAVERCVQNASAATKESSNFTNTHSYSDLATDINSFSPDDNYGEDDPSFETIQNNTMDKQAIVQVYQIFRGRFSASQNSDLDQMSAALAATTITSGNNENSAHQIENFATALSQAVRQLN